jgi:hypothetical protein
MFLFFDYNSIRQSSSKCHAQIDQLYTGGQLLNRADSADLLVMFKQWQFIGPSVSIAK